MAGKRQKPRNQLQDRRSSRMGGLLVLPSRTREKRWTRAELEGMTRDQLRRLATDAGIPKARLKQDQVEAILASDDGLASAFLPPLPEIQWPEGADWHDLTVLRWRDIWASDVAQVWDRNGDMGRLVRYIITFDNWVKMKQATSGREVVRGSHGTMRANPLFRVLTGLELDLKAAEEKLGLTPMDRMRLGIEFGGAARGIEDARKLLEDQGMPADAFTVPDGWEVT